MQERAERLEEQLRKVVLPSPKRPASGDDRWFDYYAGYADTFVADVMRALDGHATTIIDPWNGAGTTTATAAAAGVRALGFDINPAAVIVAKARLLGSDVASSLTPLADDVITHARAEPAVADDTDLLLKWLQPRAANAFRAIEHAITKVLVPTQKDLRLTDPETINDVSSLAALFYLALFRVARSVLSSFYTSNPTWIRLRVEPEERISPSFTKVAAAFRANIALLRSAVEANDYPQLKHPPEVTLANSRKLPLRAGSVSGVVTSPPYCTRIDYAIATMPELAVLGFDWEYVQNLRRELIGTPTMLDERDSDSDLGSDRLTKLLRRVERHKSYAAKTYYAPFYRQYFRSMHSSLQEIQRVTRSSAPVVVVVQDSWFKGVHVATPAILGQMAESLGWKRIGEHKFAVRTRAAMHPHRATRRTSRATETVLVLSR